MKNKAYKIPSYPSESVDAKNNEILKKMNELKAAGANVPTVSIFTLGCTPSVIPKVKNLGKSNR